MIFKEINISRVTFPIKISEDGSEIYYCGKLIHQTRAKSKNRNNIYFLVWINGQRLYVHRLVAEAFVPNDNPRDWDKVIHRDCNSLNNHYTNLFWGDCKMIYNNNIAKGLNLFGGTKKKKIPHKEELKIAKRLDKGEYANYICKEYGVSEMMINRIRKKYCKKKSVIIHYDQSIKDTIYEMYETMSIKEIKKITGLKYDTIYGWIMKRKKKSG